MANGTLNEKIAKGQAFESFDPIRLLKDLQAKMGYNAGHVIRLTDSDVKRIADVIAFHTGKETADLKIGDK